MHHLQIAITSLRQQRQEIQVELNRIDAALAALGEETPHIKPTRSAKPCCTKQEVIAIVTGLLKDNGSLSTTELEEFTKHKLANEQNKSLSGFAMRLREALADDRFQESSPGIYELAIKK